MPQGSLESRPVVAIIPRYAGLWMDAANDGVNVRVIGVGVRGKNGRMPVKTHALSDVGEGIRHSTPRHEIDGGPAEN
jgi:hypothetical protein